GRFRIPTGQRIDESFERWPDLRVCSFVRTLTGAASNVHDVVGTRATANLVAPFAHRTDRHPVARATATTPPYPMASASAPAHRRRVRSSMVALSRRHFRRTSSSASTRERRSYLRDPVDPQSYRSNGRSIDFSSREL